MSRLDHPLSRRRALRLALQGGGLPAAVAATPWDRDDRLGAGPGRGLAAAQAARPGVGPSAVVAAAASPARFKEASDFVCDGVADQVEIQAAVEAALAVGGTVFLAPGDYHLTGGVTVADGVDLAIVGAGGNATSLVMEGDFDVLSFTGVCSRIAVRDLWIGSFERRAAGTGIRVAGGDETPSDGFVVEDVRLQNVPQPVACERLDHFWLRNLEFIQSIEGATAAPVVRLTRCIGGRLADCANYVVVGTLPSDVLRIDYDCDTIIVDGCAFHLAGEGAACFRLMRSAGSSGPRLSRLLNCYAEESGGDGFLVEAGRDVRLQGCHAAANAEHGFRLLGGDSINLSDCLATANGRDGFLVQGGSGLKLEGCTASNNSQAADATSSGIRLGDRVTHTRLIGNRCGDFIFSAPNRQRHGIEIAGVGTDHLVVVGNDLTGNREAGLLNRSAGSGNEVGLNAGAGPPPAAG